MAPNTQETIKESMEPPAYATTKYQRQIVWRNVVLHAVLHLAAVYGFILIFTSAKWETTAFVAFLCVISELGVTAGAHRLWAHRSYKAKWPLRALLMIFNCIAFQNHIYEWCRDHRVHHKYSETDADPHNAQRGFFFSHIGWLLVRKHPDVITKGKTIDLSDLEADPIVAFQKKYYLPMTIFCCFYLPTVLPVWLWSEMYYNAFYVTTLFRYCLSLNNAWLVNSVAHMWGNRPYDVHISPRENRFVAFVAIGEGYHNYHHTFPWDYATSEYGWKVNITTMFINSMEWLGLAYDLRTASKDLIKKRREKTGDGS